MITCFIRYKIDPNKLSDFELYARTWMQLIEKYGGAHHGYFAPGDAPPSTAFSFPGLGEDGPDDIAIALFSFPNVEAYAPIVLTFSTIPSALKCTIFAKKQNASLSTRGPSCDR